MADAPGGKGWEPFEIALIVILIAGVLMHFNNKGAPSSTTPKPAPVAQDPDTSSCGLTVTRPLKLEAVGTTSVLVSGATHECNWPVKDGVALYVQIIDAKGMPMSAYTAVPVMDSYGQKSFSMSIALTSSPAKGTGYVLFIPAVQVGDHTTSVRVPIKFQ